MLTEPHPYPGKLIVVEGIDGSGKSTQLSLLHRWLVSQGHKACFTAWNSSIDEIQRELRRHVAAYLARSAAPAPHALEPSGPRGLPRR